MKYKPVIGLEVHVELNTKTKMFCRCSANYFGQKPNTHTCPVCLGLPGATPYTNEDAIKKCIKIGLALGCKINKKSLFERKNYFYPDLAKGYQISQYRWPLCTSGEIEVTGKDGMKSRIRINRVHQEEDTGKLSHHGQETYIDFNRSGVPLVEIVTEPDFTDPVQIKDYAKQLQKIFQSIGVSNADMEKGDMRLEANVSVRPVGQKELPNYRVELKNINSFRFMGAAVEYEIERQTKLLEAGETITMQTRGYDEDKKETFLQRSKEEANDYRYFPEPDIPLLLSAYTEKQKEQVASLLPDAKAQRLANDFGIALTSATTLVRQAIEGYFEKAARQGESQSLDPVVIATYIVNNPSVISRYTPKELVTKLFAKGQNVISTEKELKKIIREVLEDNAKMLSDYKSGNVNAIQALLGQIMRKTKGKADPKITKQLLEDLLK